MKLLCICENVVVMPVRRTLELTDPCVRDGHTYHHVIASTKLCDWREPFLGVRMRAGQVLHDHIDNVRVAFNFGVALSL